MWQKICHFIKVLCGIYSLISIMDVIRLHIQGHSYFFLFYNVLLHQPPISDRPHDENIYFKATQMSSHVLEIKMSQMDPFYLFLELVKLHGNLWKLTRLWWQLNAGKRLMFLSINPCKSFFPPNFHFAINESY